MSSTQQQIQGLLSQYTQSQGVQSRKVIGVGNTVPCSSAQHSSESSTLLSPFSTSRIRPEKSPLPSLERPKKRLKLEGKPPDNEVTENLRSCVCNHKLKEMSCLKNKYRNNLMELFFLQNMGNIMDYYVWCKRPDTKVLQFLKAGKLDSEDEDDWCSEKSITSEFGNDTFSSGNFGTTKSSISSPTSGGLNSIIELNEAKPSVKNVETGAINERTEFSVLSGVTSESCSIDHSGFSAMQQVKSAAGSAVHDSIVGTPEAIVERAKQEAAVVQRVSELRKDGLWSSRRLPKVQEPSRNKAHWDYLLEEMQWLAADFAQERKWKKAGARKIANMIGKYHKEQQQKEMKAEKDEFTKLKRIASNIGKMVKEFWSNIEKVVEFKQQSRLQEKRKKALDLHLSFIVDQTEKYSTWLTEGLGSTTHCSSATLSPSVTSHDGDFEPCGSESDDEETINEEEVFDKNEDNAFEVEELQKEMELPFDELLKTLPKELLDHPASTKIHSESEESFGEESVIKRKRKSSEDFYPSNESSDDEETVEKEEESNPEEDTGEINELQSEGNLPLEELVKKYAAAYDSDFEIPSDSEEDTETESQSCLSESYDEDNDEGKCGMEYLMKDLEDEDSVMRKVADTPGKDLTDIAAAAQSIQPTGYTLETTLVKTPVPFLLKHTLREYQVVGLDWMATMYERRLNGILADEMGLGKTIQTIALLTHLACDKGVWGPHLIVVPTSVMLNWEMEFKKWCPSFKILTYFGNQKERKAKRTGWTKTNAFHVCITSYKLVIQDHQAFRRKKWKYFILDEAQNIKNFKSQRWQTLLNFNSQRRLLLTGTPLQNSLMELWSLMHFLMPNVFQSHREFKEWFANPLTGMIEGSREYNENLVKRLHKVLRPFLLRRLKQDVEKQMPKKYEHVVRCHLSRRQRFLYDDFMSQAKTKETLATGHYMSVINILMQLRKVCNHPNLFDPRPIISPFKMKRLTYTTASIVLGLLLANDPLKVLDLNKVCPCLAELELSLPAFVAHRIRRLQTPQKSIEEIDSQPEPESRPVPLDKPLKISLSSSPLPFNSGRCSPFLPAQHRSGSPIQLTSNVSNGQTNQTSSSLPTSLSCATSTPNSSQQPITVQIQNTPQGTRLMIPSGQLSQLPGYIQIVQTPSGQQIIATSQPPPNQTSSSASVINSSSITTESVPRRTDSIQLPTASTITQKPVMKVPPLTSWENTTVTSSGMKMTAAHQQVISSPEVGLPVQKRVPCSQNSISVVSTRVPNKTVFCSKKLEEKRMKRHNYMVQRIIRNNKYNCELKPVYGSDLFDAVNALNETQDLDHSRWHGLGFIHCHSIYNCNPDRPNVLWKQTKALKSLVHNPLGYLQELKDILERYTFATPTVTAEQIEMRTFHPPPSLVQSQRRIEHVLHSELSPKTACLHRISTNMTVQFPEVRLIQYDCGKLQTLDILLRQLKSGQHRVLIFTQMTKMLDVLESFLNYHGHRYLRLDGTTKVEQRQALMERFNADKRIFVFILSTRSGGLGVNLTGADTVIFYDSDWNPTMDAQAQDRCHRIGQTRDVHIYRLISEKTIEENILKKANQKRLLSDVTIEGGNFTTAFFKQNTIEELFQEPSGLDAFIKEKNESSSSEAPSSKKQEHLTEEKCNTPGSRPSSRASNGNINEDLIEQALGAAEDEGDVQAAKSAKAEQSAELAEFDENIPWDEKEVEQKKENDEVLSRVEQELAMLQKELTPVERYAVTHLEGELAPVQVDELEKAEEEVTLAKEEWELNRLKALKEEEERRAELEEDDMLFTYSWEDANNQVKNKRSSSKKTKAVLKSKRAPNKVIPMGLMDKYELSIDPVVKNDPIVKGKIKRKTNNITSSASDEIQEEPPMFNALSIKAKRIRRTGEVTANVGASPSKKIVTGLSDKVKPRKKSGTPQSKGKSSLGREQSKSSSKTISTQNLPKPWSNPNLVIRTRKASTKEVNEKCVLSNKPLSMQQNNDDVESENGDIDVVSVVPSTMSAIQPVLSKLKANLANVGAALAQVQASNKIGPSSTSSQPTIKYLQHVQGPRMSPVLQGVRSIQINPSKLQHVSSVPFNSLRGIVSAVHGKQIIAQKPKGNSKFINEGVPILEKMAMQLSSNSAKPFLQSISIPQQSVTSKANVPNIVPTRTSSVNRFVHHPVISGQSINSGGLPTFVQASQTRFGGVQQMLQARPIPKPAVSYVPSQNVASLGNTPQVIQKGISGQRIMYANRIVQPQMSQVNHANQRMICPKTLLSSPQRVLHTNSSPQRLQTVSNTLPTQGIQIGNQIIRLQNLPAVPNQIIQLKTSSGQQQFIQIRQVIPEGGGSPQTVIINKPGLILSRPVLQTGLPRTILQASPRPPQNPAQQQLAETINQTTLPSTSQQIQKSNTTSPTKTSNVICID